MGLGSHKILDFLNIGLNMPLNYHPTSFYSKDYTKNLLELVNQRQIVMDFAKNKEDC
jgi:hypothetical protein